MPKEENVLEDTYRDVRAALGALAPAINNTLRSVEQQIEAIQRTFFAVAHQQKVYLLQKMGGVLRTDFPSDATSARLWADNLKAEITGLIQQVKQSLNRYRKPSPRLLNVQSQLKALRERFPKRPTGTHKRLRDQLDTLRDKITAWRNVYLDAQKQEIDTVFAVMDLVAKAVTNALKNSPNAAIQLAAHFEEEAQRAKEALYKEAA